MENENFEDEQAVQALHNEEPSSESAYADQDVPADESTDQFVNETDATSAEDEAHVTEHEPEDAAQPVPQNGVDHAPPPHEGADVSKKNWYIIHAYSGFEQKVAESLRSRAQAFGFADRLGQILIPTEEVVELRNGKKVTSKRLLYPGYVIVEMEMDDELWHAVKSTPRVTGFVGGGTKPVPLTADEVNAVLYRQAPERPRPKMTFEKNETVKIIDGPFTNFSGKVDEINTERNTLRVMVTIFGRSTPVELDFLQVEKI